MKNKENKGGGRQEAEVNKINTLRKDLKQMKDTRKP